MIKCFDDSIFEPKLVSFTAQKPEDDVAKEFVLKLEEDVRGIFQFINKRTLWHRRYDKGRMTKAEYEDFSNAKTCHICDGGFCDEDKKVLDHCHLTGKYRGAAHNSCNRNFILPKFVTVIFHNLSGYDSHLFIRKLGMTPGKIGCIPNNEEKYITFSKKIVVKTFKNKEGKEVEVKKDIRFVDSMRFMSDSLDKLAGNLQKTGEGCFRCLKGWMGKTGNVEIIKAPSYDEEKSFPLRLL